MASRLEFMAVASGGGHWEQLQVLARHFGGLECRYVTTNAALPEKLGITAFDVVTDCNFNQPGRALACLFQLAGLVIKYRPAVILSTGAAPGLLCLALGRLIGARTIWIDSVANAEQLSLSGKMARFVAHEWLTQWPHLAQPSGPHFKGSVL